MTTSTEPKRIKSGDIAAFVVTLTPAQRRRWDIIWESFQAQLAEAKGIASSRDQLFNAIQSAMGDVTPEQIKHLVANGIAKGDAQVLRVLAQLGGADLTEKPASASGEGAKVIIFKPFSEKPEVVAQQEEVKQIAPAAPPVKRGRGRPRKYPLPTGDTVVAR